MEEGIIPTKLLLSRCKCCKSDNLPMSAGIVPLNWLKERLSLSKEFKCVMEDGMVPDSRLLCNDKSWICSDMMNGGSDLDLEE